MNKYLGYIPKPLLNDIVQGRCIPVIGAGFSRNAELPSDLEMPSWENMGKYFADLIPDYPFSTPVDAISAFSYEFSRVKLVEELSKILHINDARPGSAHISFAKLPFNIVITTNFDFLLERSYELIRRSYRPVMEEDQLSINLSEPGTVILKIHGDLNHPSRLIVTEEDYDTFLEKYPLLSTYISNLLISRTPFFIGYSLDDPDFRHLWQIIGNRLGKLRRPAYTVKVRPNKSDIARYERRGARVIALPGTEENYGEILSLLSQEMKEYWDRELIENSIIVSGESQYELLLPKDSLTRLCFFAIPTRLHAYYKNYVFPIAESYGFTPFTAMDVLSPEENTLAKISNLIDRATLLVAEMSSPWVFLEINLAYEKEDRILVIAEKGSEIPLDIRSLRVIQRTALTEPPSEKFVIDLKEFFGKYSKELEEELHNEPVRLLKRKEYRAAVSAAMTLLEAELKEILIYKTLNEQKVPQHLPFFQILAVAKEKGLLSSEECDKVSEWRNIRNRAVHTKEWVGTKEAQEVVNGTMEILKSLEERL